MRLMKASFGRSKGFLDYARNDIIAAAGRFFDAAFGLAQNDKVEAAVYPLRLDSNNSEL